MFFVSANKANKRLFCQGAGAARKKIPGAGAAWEKNQEPSRHTQYDQFLEKFKRVLCYLVMHQRIAADCQINQVAAQLGDDGKVDVATLKPKNKNQYVFSLFFV